jgi:hypothetical protein
MAHGYPSDEVYGYARSQQDGEAHADRRCRTSGGKRCETTCSRFGAPGSRPTLLSCSLIFELPQRGGYGKDGRDLLLRLKRGLAPAARWSASGKWGTQIPW